MKNLLFLFALLACFTACSKDDGGNYDDYDDYDDCPEIGTIAFADVTDAVALYITAPVSEGEVETRAALDTTAGNTLFKITGSGETVKVQFTSEDQDSVNQPQVYFIKDLSEKYIYMSYDNVYSYDEGAYYDEETDTYSRIWIPNWEHTQVIIKKDDGAVFKIESKESLYHYDYSDPYNWYYVRYDLITEETDIQVDYKGDVYIYSDGYIIKIYTHGKEVFLTPINRDDMDIDRNRWLVDQQGNVIINKTYTRLASGEFTRSPEIKDNAKVFTVYGDSEGFYRLVYDSWYEDGYSKEQNWIQYCQAEAPAMVWKNQVQFFENGSIDHQWYATYRTFSYKDKTIVIARTSGYNSAGIQSNIKLTIYDRNRVEEEVLEDCVLLESGGSSSDWGYEYYGNTHPCTEKYAYKVTDQQIWRAEIETGKAELLYDYGKEYMIKSIKVKNNIVTCDAFELRRGNDVVMEIYEDKSVHLVESVNNDKIIYLERLN